MVWGAQQHFDVSVKVRHEGSLKLQQLWRMLVCFHLNVGSTLCRTLCVYVQSRLAEGGFHIMTVSVCGL